MYAEEKGSDMIKYRSSDPKAAYDELNKCYELEKFKYGSPEQFFITTKVLTTCTVKN